MQVYGHEAIKEIASSHIKVVNAIDVQREETWEPKVKKFDTLITS